ncbi:hypothetical protein MSG28_004508 [Choristoneura fumiferana]|uniref:Uncharacterized protein n=1 Tax=Choristoneura fumiferana TaxID=7141 RepID=A0ACC0K6H6_CHOFU|nr:hypothetical protein MSG28_004508 [Choristoneura fumiferana]
MCHNIEIEFPTIEHFLLLYSLKCGSVTVCGWSMSRALFTAFFFTEVILEAFLDNASVVGKLFVHEKPPYDKLNELNIFYSCVMMVIAESMLIVCCMHLAAGLIAERGARTSGTCCVGWGGAETGAAKSVVSVIELYGIVVVYSLYACMQQCKENDCEKKCSTVCESTKSCRD